MTSNPQPKDVISTFVVLPPRRTGEVTWQTGFISICVYLPKVAWAKCCINWLELQAVWLTMKHFLPQLPGAVVDYSCIHQQGGREAVILPVTASLANVAMV